MRSCYLLWVMVLCTCLSSQAQNERELANPLIDSKEVLQKGVAFHEKRDFKAAIAEFQKVPASDTNYSSILHELYLSSYLDSNFVDAENYMLLAMDMFPEKRLTWLRMLADLYDDTKRTEQSLAAYDTIAAGNPFDYLTYYNKGISLVRQEKMDEAIPCFQKCVTLNPYYSLGHYFLGSLSYLKGNLVPAMMSLTTSLLISPDHKNKDKAISFLADISKMNTTVTTLLKNYKATKENNFDELQDIITSKAALNTKYKTLTDIDDPVLRQLQVLIEKLEYNASDKGFWMQYYVPMFKSIWDDKMFEPLMMTVFSELDIKQIQSYMKSKKKDVEKVQLSAVNYLNEIRETQELQFTKRADTKLRYTVKDYNISGKGTMAKNAKNEDIYVGPWVSYYPTANIKSKGNLDNEGELTGEWQYFYETGMKKEVTNYQGGKANGKSESWYDNGLRYNTCTYKDDELNGLETTYYYNGHKLSEVNFAMGKKNGPAKYYNINGILSRTCTYKDDKTEGEELYYYSNGQLSSKEIYTDNKSNGEYKEFYEDGKLKKTGLIVDDKKTGAWKTYYQNGNPEFLEIYKDGELDGEYSSYYENGKLEAKGTYNKGKAEGKREYYDKDGILCSETILEKGRLREIRFFDKKGTMISNTSSRKGNAFVTFYTPDGIKSQEGYYTKNGDAEGKSTSYYKNGKTASESNYKEGYLEGKKVSYYATGQVSQTGTFKSDMADGYFINYYNNGAVANEGWYVAGDRQGTFLYYNERGDLTTRTYYLNDKVSGVQEYFYPGRKPSYTEYYDTDWFRKLVQFDTTGKILSESALHQGKGKLLFKHFNGKPHIESEYDYYVLNGVYRVTNGDGSIKSISYYKNGNPDSIYKAWYPDGTMQLEGRYDKDGKRTGTWKTYWENGQLSETEQFEKGELTGKDTQYNEDGSLDKEMDFKKNELNGEYKIYADNNQLAIVLYWNEGELTGYSYEGKDGKLVPVVPVKGGTGDVTAYFKNGTKSAFMQFNESQNNGDRMLYYSNGKERITGKRVNGLEDGVKKVYYPNGKLMKEQNFYQGELDGNSKFYDPNGNLVYDVNYYSGELHGKCKYYKNGKLVVTYVYYYSSLEEKITL